MTKGRLGDGQVGSTGGSSSSEIAPSSSSSSSTATPGKSSMDSHLSRDPCGARLEVEVIGIFPDDDGGGRTAVGPTMAVGAEVAQGPER